MKALQKIIALVIMGMFIMFIVLLFLGFMFDYHQAKKYPTEHQADSVKRSGDYDGYWVHLF